ncbi:regulator of chromosome condensation domain-containing protein [Cyclospora cayetanensis]|nr:regulator of chromosome condensation domain-containing protein [Cyclospora cayetanensis]
MIYSMLHQKVTQLALGSDFTVVVTGDGDAEEASECLAYSSATTSESSASKSWNSSPHILTAEDLHLRLDISGLDSSRQDDSRKASASGCEAPSANGVGAKVLQQSSGHEGP